MVQAENDNDRAAIASLLRAVEADSSNLEALLELGVSCTNELDQNQALLFMHTWLEAHPVYRELVEGMDLPDYGDYRMLEHVTSQFKRAAAMNPDDGDVSSALGVLCNLSREYDEVISFPAMKPLKHLTNMPYIVRPHRGSSNPSVSTRRITLSGTN